MGEAQAKVALTRVPGPWESYAASSSITRPTSIWSAAPMRLATRTVSPLLPLSTRLKCGPAIPVLLDSSPSDTPGASLPSAAGVVLLPPPCPLRVLPRAARRVVMARV